MKFFKPEDFDHELWYNLDDKQKAWVADLANKKLEKESIILYSYSSDHRYWEDPNDPTTQDAVVRCNLKGYLIGIESIKQCEHPRHMVHLSETEGSKPSGYFCTECGEKVTPKAFETV